VAAIPPPASWTQHDREETKLKIEMLAGDLASAAIYAVAGIPARPTVPVLAGMKIVASDGEIVLTGSDTDTIASARADANVAEPGEVVIPGKMFAEITKGLPAKEPVQLVTEKDKVILGYGHGEYELVTLVSGAYPDLPAPAQTIGKVPADMLAAAISRAMIAVRHDDAVVELTTLQMIVSAGCLTFNATDGHRLVQATAPLQAEDGAGVPQVALIPGRYPAALAKAVPGEHDVLVGLDGERGIVTFAAPERALTCRVIPGEKFPKVEKQFAKAVPSATAVIDRKALQEAAARVATVADKDTPVYLSVTPGEVRVSGGGGSGSGGETLWAELDGEDQKCGFKPALLREILDAAGTQSVAFGFTGHRKPVLITDGAQGKAHDDSFRMLLMPQTPQAVAEMAAKS
jgi:DNA polymerase III subunit beta